MEDNKSIYSCIDCGVANCNKGKKSYPDFCLTAHMKENVFEDTKSLYCEEGNLKIAQMAAKVEAEYYCKMTRVEEIIQFAKEMSFKKIGIATCVGLLSEARVAAKIFRSHGFEIYGVACKIGAQLKTSIGIDKECEKVGKNMCNPILQAKTLNEANTDLNVVIGLCVGHDSLFYKYSDAPATTLVTKDRVLGHNPAVALYQADEYYSRLIKK